jgi:CBS domain containing-hemolysin-like protein
LVFVYGELLPKELFFSAPNRLLRASAPFFIVCGILFLPITIVLWFLGRVLTMFVGESPEKLRASLARSELQRLFDEGKDEGVLIPAQRELAQTMFEFANRPLDQFSKLPGRIPSVPLGARKEDVLRLTHRSKSPEVLITEAASRRILGYALVIDLHISMDESVTEYRPLVEVDMAESPLSVLMRLQGEKESLARAVDENGKTVGIVSLQALTDAVWLSN